jgi:Ribonuclease-III-like
MSRTPKTKAALTVEPAPEAGVKAEARVESKPESKARPEAAAEPKTEAKAEAKSETKAEPKAEPKAAPKRRRRGTAEFEDRIGYRFKDAALLEQALTHISALSGARNRAGSYQRLEFLGDHVLGLIVSDMLFRTFPRADEGEMSRRLADLVRKEACADVARSIELGAAIRLGASENNAGGRNRGWRLPGRGGTDRAALAGAHAHAGAAAARRQDRAAGMGAGARAADAVISGSRTKGAGPRSGIPGDGPVARARAGRGAGTLETGR